MNTATNINSVKTMRFGSPNGNIFTTTATFKDGSTITTGSNSQDESRSRALKGETVHTLGLPAPFTSRLGEYSLDITVKQPMLVVGANVYVRERVPFFIVQKF